MLLLRIGIYRLIRQKREIYQKLMNGEITTREYLKERQKIEKEIDKIHKKIEYTKINNRIVEEILI